MRDSGKLENPSPAPAGRFRTRGCSGTDRRRDRWRGVSGTPEVSQPDPLKDARREATRRRIAGTARGCRNRGCPGTHHRRTWRSEDSGTPGDSPPDTPKGCETRGNSTIHRWHSRKDAGLGDTRGLIIGAVGRARAGATRSGSAKGVEDARFEETR